MTFSEKQQTLIDDFSLFDDWEGKYEYLIDLGKNLPLLSSEYKTEDRLVNGCQSRVWLYGEVLEGKIYFKADSDAIITKGIVSMLVNLFNGETPKTVALADMEFINQIGLKEHLSPTRSNGLVSMIKQMKTFAVINSKD